MSSPPIPRDVQDFQFKLVSRFKVFNKTERPFSGPVNALAVSSKHGLVFIASPSEIQVFETSSLLENRISKGSGADVEIFPRHCIQLPSQPSHIGISCDQVHVAVALAPKDAQCCPVALIYPVTSFTLKNPSPAWELRLSLSPGVCVRDLVWNPGLPQLMCFCLSNGSVSVYELKGSSQTFQIFSLPETTLALSVSWSPKGKQLVIGSANGTLSQYKPDLKQVKTIPAPPPNPGIASDGSIAPVSLLWLSSFQFAVVYGNPSDNGSGSSRPGLHIVNAPKGGSVSYLNYDDICYSSGELRSIQYYLSYQPKWNVLLMSSANSTEVGVLAADGSGGEPLVWEQWALEDASRAELPLSPSREEMYAIGMAIDTSPTAPIPWGENQTIPPAPLLLVLSHHGLLCAFNILNLRPGAPQDVCFPPELIPGIREVLVNSGPPSSSPALPAATSGNVSSFGALPVIACEAPGFPMTSKPSFSFAPSSQTPSSIFSSTPANQTFSSLATAANPSLFGAQTQKSDSEKGWLSGQGASTFSGFGSLGTALIQPKEGASLASAGATSFSFAQSSASIAFPGTSVTTAASFSNQSQTAPTFSFGGQSQGLSAPQAQAIAPTQASALPTQSFPSYGSGSSLMPKVPPADKGKIGSTQLGMSTTGKLKFGSTAEVPEGEGNNNSSGGNSQLWTATSSGQAVPIPPAATPKTEAQSIAPVSSVPQSLPQVTQNVAPAVSDAAIFHAIVKETELFQKELKLLKDRHQKLNIEIGSPTEKNSLVQRVDGMSNFLCELNETTQGQASEISALKTLLVEAFAWLEEAKSRQMYSKNSRYIHLAMNQDLDPVIKKHLLAIRNRIHYLDTQLQQVDSNLDSQWSQFQNSCNKRMCKNKNWYQSDSPDNLLRKEIHMPSMEYVYQTILNQQQVLEQHKVRLDELEAKLKDRANWEIGTSLYAVSGSFTARNKRASPNNHKKSSTNDQDLSSMAESLLAIQMSVSKVEGGLSAQLGTKNPLVPKKMSSRQRSQLCHLLAHRPMTRVLPTPRGMSSSAVLPIPSSLSDSISPAKTQVKSSNESVSLPFDDPVKPSSSSMKKEHLPSKSQLPASGSLPMTATTSPVIVTSSVSTAASKISVPAPASTFGIPSGSISSSVSGQSVPIMSYTAPSSSMSLAKGFAAPGMGSLATSSVVPSKASPSPAYGSFSQGIGTLSAVTTTTVTTISLSVANTPPSAVQSSAAPVTTTSTSIFCLPASTKSTVLPSSNVSIFGGVAPSNITTTSSEGSSWSFYPPGGFSIGSSVKPAVSLTENSVTTTTTTTAASIYSPAVVTTMTMASGPPAFSLNFSTPTSQTSKPSFSLSTKPVSTQSPFTLPASTFGSQGTSTSLAKEPLFVFGASSLGAGIKATSATGDSVSEKQEEIQKEEKKPEEEPKAKEEKVALEVVSESNEKIKQETTEKPTSNFSFGSAFGNSAIPFGKSSPAVTSTNTTTVAASPAVTVANPEFEDITPESKVEDAGASKEKSEEKPPPARSLFSEFNFKLSGNKTEVFGDKPSIFGGSSSPAVTSSISTSLFGSPNPVTTSLQSSVTTTPSNTSVPIISQAESSTTTPNPLSSLGNIVASLGGNNFSKSTPEVSKPSSTFSSFSFSLGSKGSDTTSATTDDSQKTPIKGFPATSPTAESSTPSTPVAGSLPTGTTDFGQGLANILGQSLPGSPSQPQQQPVANPFAGTSGLFGSSDSSSSPSTASLFGKPSDGTPSVGIFGQPLKQEGTTTSFFGSPSSTTPATTSGPTFEGGSIFGQAASSSASIFGGSGFGSSKPFGQSPGTGFSLSGSVFGQSVGASSGSTSIFGSPPASTAGASPFQTPATASSSVFGSGSSGENRLFGSVAQTGFGSPSSSFQAKPGGFGGSPVFGSMTSGNTSPSFGGAATFGSPPSFGSHVFGSATGSPLFGSSLPAQGTAPASTFENLATAQTLTFGNLAQSSNTGSPFGGVGGASTSQAPPAFGSAGGSGTGSGSSSFGGSSFTSWR